VEADWLCLQSRPKKADIRTPSVSCSSRCPQAVEFTHCYRPYPSDWATRTQLRRSASAPSWRGTRRRRSGGKRCVGREEKSHAALKPQVLSLNNSRFFAEIRSPFRPRSTLRSCWWSRDLRRKASRFEADVLSVIADTLTQAGTAARWERHGIGAQELAMHLLDTSAGAKSATGNLSDYKRRMALSIRIIVMGANGGEI